MAEETTSQEKEVIKSNAKLDTPRGLTEAAQQAFNAVAEGRLDASQGNVLQKLIRGQAYLLGDLPLQYLRIVKDVQKDGSSTGTPMGDVINKLNSFLKEDEDQKKLA